LFASFDIIKDAVSKYAEVFRLFGQWEKAIEKMADRQIIFTDALSQEMLEKINREDPWICDITAGVGVYAAIPQTEDNIDIFMTRADKAMYDDKNKRKYGRRKDDCVKMSGLMEKAMDSKMK
jgi:GGDEF domain-containing protein